MMKDLNNTLYDPLLPLHNSNELIGHIEMLIPNASKAQQLIVKMDIRRRMSVCNNSIDLRGKVAGECRPYVLLGRTHWLDDVAINTYYCRVDIYQHQMTVGLFEELHQTPNSYRMLQQQKNVPASVITNTIETHPMVFGHLFSRHENRIQVTGRIQVFLPNGTEVNGSTIDMSSSGMRIKLPISFSYEVNSILMVYFPQLGDECQIPALFSGLEYRIIGQEPYLIGDSAKRVRLQLLTQTDAVKEAIAFKIAQKNKKSRLENEDKIFHLRTQSYEQIFLEQTPSLPLFFNQDQLTYCLLTEKNKPLWDYWHDERDLPVISHLFSPRRLEEMSKNTDIPNEIWVYCFSHRHHDKIHFLSATSTELTKELRQLFGHHGSIRASWRVLRLSMEKITQGSIEQLQQNELPYKQRFNELTHLISLQDVTLLHANSDFRQPIKPTAPVKLINQFLHPRTTTESAQIIPVTLNPQRKEERYKHITRVSVHYPLQTLLEGETIDLSPHGLHLALKQPFTGSKSDNVFVTFSRLQSMDPMAPLSNVPYQIIKISANRMEMMLSLMKNRHSERQIDYLSELIEYNKNKLKIDPELLQDPILVQEMHQFLLSHLTGIPYFLSKKGGVLQLSAIGVNSPKHPLARLLEKGASESMISLRLLFGDKISTFANAVTRKQHRKKQIQHEIYLAIKCNDNGEKHIVHRTVDSFISKKDRILFIRQARENGEFFAIRNWMQPIEDGLHSVNSKHFDQIMKESIAKARQIEHEFTQLCVYGELADITNEVLLRLEISPQCPKKLKLQVGEK